MGGSHSREERLEQEEDGASADHEEILGEKLQSLSIQDDSSQATQICKLYRHIGGNTEVAKWVIVKKQAQWRFVRENELSEDEEDEDEESEEEEELSRWFLDIGEQIHACINDHLQMRLSDAQLRADFIYHGVWAVKLKNVEEYKDFVNEYRNCLFENTYKLEANEENKLKIYGKDFAGWHSSNKESDETIWEDAQPDFKPPAIKAEDRKQLGAVKETYTESVQSGIQSITLGGLENSFLVSSTGVEVFENTATGLHKKSSSSIRFEDGTSTSKNSGTPKKGILMKAEKQMIVMSPNKKDSASSIQQLDLETGKVAAQWKFEKDGTPIQIKDLTTESKDAQLDASVSTFLGLDDNKLCRWDLREKHGINWALKGKRWVNVDDGPLVLDWAEGHEFARGTNFLCFAAAGDGSIAVGSKDGKIRLYGTSSMRQAKTAFPGLGSPITSIDVTYDGNWVLGTTDTYLVLLSTVFRDKDGKMKTGFSGRMGIRNAPPRLLKLTPLDAFLAGKEQKFHGGQFSWVTSGEKLENHLVVTVGKYTVIWDFNRVKQKHECYEGAEGLKSCYCYTVVPKEESIVESKFMHESFETPEAPLIVATPKKLSSYT